MTPSNKSPRGYTTMSKDATWKGTSRYEAMHRAFPSIKCFHNMKIHIKTFFEHSHLLLIPVVTTWILAIGNQGQESTTPCSPNTDSKHKHLHSRLDLCHALPRTFPFNRGPSTANQPKGTTPKHHPHLTKTPSTPHHQHPTPSA